MNESFKVPVTKETLAVATQKHGPFFATGLVGPKESRIYTVGARVIDANGNIHPLPSSSCVRRTTSSARCTGSS